ncbi:MAG: 3-deoxy-7-phosphoheptulonate synthase [Chlamydiae bacterium]|nr:3-deoxy-7-phosphoheptulonate synthase [Chlamydiota bacterium]
MKNLFPLLPKQREFVEKSRQTAKRLFLRQDDRLVFIIGPCSIHHLDSALEYAHRLKTLSVKMDSSCFFIMRSYFEKPRSGVGWKGFIPDPHFDESGAIEEGLIGARKFLLSLAEMEMPTATEFLSPLVAPYIEDLITWGFIGARTTTSQIHRQLASSLSMPIGFKNTLDGNIECAIQGVIAAKQSHHFLHIDEEGKIQCAKSPGNPFSHVVLRGSCSKENDDPETVVQTQKRLRFLELNPSILVDCAHGNSQKQFFKQKDSFFRIMHQIQRGNTHIMGMMVESYLKSGAQKVENKKLIQRDVSVTDPCLDWEATEELFQSISSSSVVASSSSSI